jgi:hypothetical protein
MISVSILAAFTMLASTAPPGQNGRFTALRYAEPTLTRNGDDTARFRDTPNRLDERHCLIRKSNGRRECRTMPEWEKIAENLEDQPEGAVRN